MKNDQQSQAFSIPVQQHRPHGAELPAFRAGQDDVCVPSQKEHTLMLMFRPPELKEFYWAYSTDLLSTDEARR
jgi:hypothetical protein